MCVPRDDVIESTRFLMRPPVIIPPWSYPLYCIGPKEYSSLPVTLLYCTHYTSAPLFHCSLLLSEVLYNALHQYCMPLHFTADAVLYTALYFTARCRALHCTVFHNTLSALHSTAFYHTVQCPTLRFTSTSLQCTSLHGAVRFTIYCTS